MRWVSRPRFDSSPPLNLKMLICFSAHAFILLQRGEITRKESRVGDKNLIGGKEVEALLVGLLSGEAFAAASLTGSKA